MFHIIEKYRTPAQIMLGLIGISFVGFGIASFETTGGNNYIVRIGEQVITRNDLERALQQTEATGVQADRQAVFQTLMNRAYLMEGAKELGITVSDVQIKQMIVDTPDFHDANGKFDPSKFQAFLQQTRQSEEAFMESERERLILFTLLKTLNGSIITDAQAAQFLNARFAERTMRTSIINPEAFAEQVKVDDALLKKYYDSNPKNYTLSQGVKYEYIVLSPKDLVAQQSVSDAEVQAALKDVQAATKPKRRIAHILIAAAKSADEATRNQARTQAEQIAKQVQAAPDKFADFAKQYSQDAGSANSGGDLGLFAQDGSLPAKSVEDAAFQLSEGAVSGIVESDYGFHIVRVTDIESTDETAQIARVRQNLQEKKAQQAYAKLRDELSELAFATPTDLRAAAQKLGLTVQTQNEWLTQTNSSSLNVPKAVADALFGDEVFNKKHNSEPINVDGTTWFVRATETRKESIEAFDAVRERVQTDYVRAESVRLAREHAQKMLQQLNSDKPPLLAWSPEQTVLPPQVQALVSPDDYTHFMNAQPKNGKPAYVVVERAGNPEIIEVRSITAPNDPKIINTIKAQLGELHGESIAEMFIDSLRKRIPTKQGAEKVADE